MPGRRTVSRRTALIRVERQPYEPLSSRDVSTLIASLSKRDLAILLALHQHRYLDTAQLRQLFFTDARYCQRRLRWLADRGLVHRWRRVQAAGLISMHSVHLLSRSGATVLAGVMGRSEGPLHRRSDDAWEHCFHVDHDLEANSFFVELAAAAAAIPDQGLYHWVGESTAREVYRQRRCRLSPDGWGRYLAPGREITLFLEWDRATESPHRLKRKVSDYAEYFAGRPEAERQHVLFVAPTAIREAVIRRVLEGFGAPGGCAFWTAVAEDVLKAPLGPVWAGRLSDRVGLTDLAGHPRSDRPTGDSIAKPMWWERRPGGSEVA